MAPHRRNPYETLGVSADVSDQELRRVYRRLVQLHHPDHNGGSADSARRFEAIQDAYAQVGELRRAGAAPVAPPAGTGTDPDLEARIAGLEHELSEAQRARERIRQQARETAAQEARGTSGGQADDARDGRAHTAGGRRPGRPSDEELGYVRTDDSFAKILADARTEVADRVEDALDAIASRLTEEQRRRSQR